jgi:hypothetical protein
MACRGSGMMRWGGCGILWRGDLGVGLTGLICRPGCPEKSNDLAYAKIASTAIVSTRENNMWIMLEYKSKYSQMQAVDC